MTLSLHLRRQRRKRCARCNEEDAPIYPGPSYCMGCCAIMRCANCPNSRPRKFYARHKGVPYCRRHFTAIERDIVARLKETT